MLSGSLCHVYAQIFTTHYGQSTGPYGDYNSWFGAVAGYFSTGNYNAGVGNNALIYGGIENVAVGAYSMGSGQGCTAVGYYAMKSNCAWCQPGQTESGFYNTGVGYRCMQSNRYGDYNTAVGAEALFANEANANAAFGYYSLRSNTSGYQNINTL